MNNEQVTADALSTQAENELICEKLLGWHRPPAPPPGCYNTIDWSESRTTPSFTTWAEAGLILDWLMSHIGPGLPRFRDGLAFRICNSTLTPLVIRAAALEYIRSLS